MVVSIIEEEFAIVGTAFIPRQAFIKRVHLASVAMVQ